MVMLQTQSFQGDFHRLQGTTEVGGTSVTESPEAGFFEDNGSIVIDLEELATGLHSQIMHEILYAVPKDDSVRSTLEEVLENFENSFVRRMKQFNEKWGQWRR